MTPPTALAEALPAPTLADCDQRDFATVLVRQADVRPSVARAYWLSDQLIKWPGANAGDRFRLAWSRTAQLRISGSHLRGEDGELRLQAFTGSLPADLAERFKFVPEGPVLQVAEADLAKIPELLRGQVWLVREGAAGRAQETTLLQIPGALDRRYAAAGRLESLGVSLAGEQANFLLWAPTAQAVSVCIFDSSTSAASAVQPLRQQADTGAWSARPEAARSGRYYRYLVDVHVPGTGLVRNRVTDPYSIGLGADSRRSFIADLDAPQLKPAGWDSTPAPTKVRKPTDMVIYELHVRDFSINDASVPPADRGKYAAFSHAGSQGMKHLQALSDAGLTDVHLLPVFDLATVPESGCVTPSVHGEASSETQQAQVMALASLDCFNWGYDPYHFNAPEGSYASDATDGAARIIEFRRMVQALHRAGLRVGMDVVYNHTSASGQQEKSVLDRIVPGYYHRLDGAGQVERSTCCENTATEHLMMARLMLDSAVLWARQYRIDSFRFDLMGHQPRAVMVQLQQRVDAATGRHVNLIGEGWNFGEVADGARFVQASQLSLNGTGIGTFSDRARDAVRGGRAGDSGAAMLSQQGYINGLVYAPNAHAPARPASDLLQAADLVRVGLAGSLRDYPLLTWNDERKPLHAIAYGDQPAGYASEPDEVVNYVENHDNHTLFDSNALKLPLETSASERARIQMLGAAITAFSQGIAYFHAGIDLLRSKSLDRNSFDSGDWFNRLDFSYRDNYFGTGLPPKQDNGRDYGLLKPLLDDAARIKPGPTEITFARDCFRDLLRIRASSSLFRLSDADSIRQRLSFPNTGSQQNPVILAGHLDGRGLADAGFKELLYLVNVHDQPQSVALASERGKRYRLHPVHLAATAADKRPLQARFEAAHGRFLVPARTALVFVVH